MALKITRESDPINVEQIVCCFYGQPGIGKTTLGFTAESPLLLDFDGGAYRAGNRKDSVQVETWQDVTGIKPEDLTDYKTVVVDTAGRALDVLTTDIIRRNAKMGRGGSLTLQGYGALKSEFLAWLKWLKGFKLDVVLLTHADEIRKDDDIKVRLDVQGGSKNELYKSSDVMGELALVNNKRTLDCTPSERGFGKNPAEMEPQIVEAGNPRFLADYIAEVKHAINTKSAAALERQKELDAWQAKIDAAETSSDFNLLVSELHGSDDAVLKKLLHKAATDSGMEWDKEVGCYVEKEAEKEAEVPA